MKDYKKFAEMLCKGYLNLPCGCEGCPLEEFGKVNEDGDFVCILAEEENNDDWLDGHN